MRSRCGRNRRTPSMPPRLRAGQRCIQISPTSHCDIDAAPELLKQSSWNSPLEDLSTAAGQLLVKQGNWQGHALRTPNRSVIMNYRNGHHRSHAAQTLPMVPLGAVGQGLCARAAKPDAQGHQQAEAVTDTDRVCFFSDHGRKHETLALQGH